MPIDKSRKPSPEGQGDQSRQSREQKEQKPLNNETPDERLQRHTRFLRTATNGSTDSPSSSYYRTEQRAESNDRRQKDKFNRDSNTWADQMDYRINTTKMWNDRAYDNRSQIMSKDMNVHIIKERSRNNGDIEVKREQYFISGDTGIKKD